MKLYGVHASPFVRKVRIALAEKGLAYEHEPVLPFNQPREYFAISPLGKIPAIVDDQGRALSDSSVILTYLERTHPQPALLPADPYEHARALWFEEYGDSALAQNLTGTIFLQRIVAPRFLQRPTDEAVIEKALQTDLPPIFDYLTAELGDGQFLVGGAFSIADVGVVTHFVNARLAGFSLDAGRWPKLAAYVGRLFTRPSIRTIVAEEAALFGVEL